MHRRAIPLDGHAAVADAVRRKADWMELRRDRSGAYTARLHRHGGATTDTHSEDDYAALRAFLEHAYGILVPVQEKMPLVYSCGNGFAYAEIKPLG